MRLVDIELWHWIALLGGITIILILDLFVFHRPLKALLVRLVNETGGLPLWNPYLGSGQPFAANPQQALFHPLTSLFFLLPFEWAFRLQVALPPLAAGAGMFLLQRQRRRSRTAAGLSALSWGLGGYLLSATHLLPTLFAASLLPAVAGCALGVTRSRGGRWPAALAGLVTLVALGGEPTTLLLTPVVIATALAGTRGRDRRRAGLRVVLALALGAGLAACQLLPALRLAAHSVRAQGLDERAASLWSMPVARLGELAVPSAFALRRDRSQGPAQYPDRGEPFLYSLYPGAAVTVLALAGLVAAAARPSRRRTALPWAACGLLGALLAVGPLTPIWPALRALPLLSGLRFPEKFVVLAVLAVVVLAGDGCDRWRAGRGRLARALLHPACLWLLVAGDLVHAGRGLVRSAAPARLDARPAAVALLGRAPDGPVYNAAGWTRAAGETISLNLLRPPLSTVWGLATTLEPDFDLTELGWSRSATARFRELQREDPAAAWHAARRRGVAAVLRLRDDVRVTGGVLSVPPGVDSLVDVVLLGRPQPFAFCATRVERLAEDAGWARAVEALGREAVETVLVDEREPGEWPRRPAPGQVTLLERSPTRLRLEVSADGPGPSVLAINQTWDELWQARLDGRRVPLPRVDLALTALSVPPGRHRVELDYRDPWLRAGLVSSAACGLVLLAWAARRRPPAPGGTPSG